MSATGAIADGRRTLRQQRVSWGGAEQALGLVPAHPVGDGKFQADDLGMAQQLGLFGS
jgi:hypothetical protein